MAHPPLQTSRRNVQHEVRTEGMQSWENETGRKKTTFVRHKNSPSPFYDYSTEYTYWVQKQDTKEPRIKEFNHLSGHKNKSQRRHKHRGKIKNVFVMAVLLGLIHTIFRMELSTVWKNENGQQLKAMEKYRSTYIMMCQEKRRQNSNWTEFPARHRVCKAPQIFFKSGRKKTYHFTTLEDNDIIITTLHAVGPQKIFSCGPYSVNTRYEEHVQQHTQSWYIRSSYATHTIEDELNWCMFGKKKKKGRFRRAEKWVLRIGRIAHVINHNMSKNGNMRRKDVNIFMRKKSSWQHVFTHMGSHHARCKTRRYAKRSSFCHQFIYGYRKNFEYKSMELLRRYVGTRTIRRDGKTKNQTRAIYDCIMEFFGGGSTDTSFEVRKIYDNQQFGQRKTKDSHLKISKKMEKKFYSVSGQAGACENSKPP